MYLRKSIVHDNVQITYFTTPSKKKSFVKSVVYCHGDAQDHAVGIPYLSLFPEKYQKISIDLPGHGASSDFDSRTLQTEVDVLEHVLDTESCKAPFIIGHSHGAALASLYAARHDISGMVLIDPFFMDPRDIFGKWKITLLEKIYLLSARGKYDADHSDRNYSSERSDKEVQTASFIHTPHATLRKNLAIYEGFDSRDAMNHMEKPVLVLNSGNYSVLSVKKHIHDVLQTMPNARLRIIKEGTHHMPILMKDVLSKEIRNHFGFLDV